MPTPLSQSSLARDCRGVVAIQTAVIMSLILMPLIALAVDFERVYTLKTRLDAAADSAVLLAASVIANELMGQTPDGTTVSSQQAQLDGIKAADDRFAALEGDIVQSTEASGIVFTPAVTVVGTQITVSSQYSATPKTMFVHYWGSSLSHVGGLATAALHTLPYIDIQLVVDTSESMNIGATQADIQNLKLLTAQSPEPNCAFACHTTSIQNENYWQMVQDWNANPASYRQNNPNLPTYPSGSISLRSQVLRDAVGAMISAMQTQQAGGRYRLGIGTFGNENSSTQLWSVQSPNGSAPITGWFNQVFGGTSGNAPLPGGGSVPALGASSDFATAAAQVAALDPPLSTRHDTSTDLNSVVKQVAQQMPASGTGADQAHAQKFVFLVTDGMIDWNYAQGRYIGGLDPTVCSDLKAKGITVAVLYTEYVRDNSMWWWWWGTDQSFSSLEPALQSCASPNFYFKASTTNIGTTLSTMLTVATGNGATLTH
jgi:Flp pilus assembly protein TadG